MSIEEKLLNIAGRELDQAVCSNSPDEELRAKLAGHIGEFANNRTEYIQEAQSFIDNIDMQIDGAIDTISDELPDSDNKKFLKELIKELRDFKRQVKKANIVEFLRLAGEEWDEVFSSDEETVGV